MKRKLIIGLIAVFTFLAGINGLPSVLNSVETEPDRIAKGCEGPNPPKECPPPQNGNSWGG